MSLKMGDFNTPSVFYFSKKKRRFEIYYFKTAVLLCKANYNGLVVKSSAAII